MLPLFATLSIVGVAAAQVATTTEPTLPEIEAAASTTLPLSPKSDVRGVAFQRFYQVWLENVVSRASMSGTVYCRVVEVVNEPAAGLQLRCWRPKPRMACSARHQADKLLCGRPHV